MCNKSGQIPAIKFGFWILQSKSREVATLEEICTTVMKMETMGL
jgi:hypothetical protein